MARKLEPVSFGQAAIGATLFVVALGIGRSVVGEVLLVQGPSSSFTRQHQAFAASISLGFIVGLPIAIGGFFAQSMAPVLLIVGASLPGLLAQDALRYISFAVGEPLGAVRVDLTWTIISAFFLVVDTDLGALGQWSPLIYWLFAASLASLLELRFRGMFSVGVLRGSWIYLRGHAKLYRPYIASFLVGAGTRHLGLIGLALVSSIEDVGAAKGADLLFGPILALFGGIYPVLLPRARQNVARGELDILRKSQRRVSGSVALMCFGLTLFLLAMPNTLGVALLGSTWENADDLLLAAGLSYVALTSASGALITLRATGFQRIVLQVQLFVVPIQLLAPLLLASIVGPSGFFYGLTLSLVVYAVAIHVAAGRVTSP